MNLTTILDWIMDALYSLASVAVSWLPVSPFQSIEWSQDSFTYMVLSWVNYFIPLGWIMGIMSSYLTAVLIWYGVRWVLRFVRYID